MKCRECGGNLAHRACYDGAVKIDPVIRRTHRRLKHALDNKEWVARSRKCRGCEAVVVTIELTLAELIEQRRYPSAVTATSPSGRVMLALASGPKARVDFLRPPAALGAMGSLISRGWAVAVSDGRIKLTAAGRAALEKL